MDEARERRLAANEAIAREVNAQVEQLAARWNHPDSPMELLCECSLDECSDRIHVPLADYTRVRESAVQFMLVDAHVIEEIEERVGEAGDATVVEKTGPGRDVAAQLA